MIVGSKGELPEILAKMRLDPLLSSGTDDGRLKDW